MNTTGLFSEGEGLEGRWLGRQGRGGGIWEEYGRGTDLEQ